MLAGPVSTVVPPMSPSSITDLDGLLTYCRGHSVPKMLFFWGDAAPPGRITKACLSQWWPAPFTLDGILYLTAEHYMMAAKARLFADQQALARILDAPDPATAKQRGREVRGYDDATWAAARFAAVVAGNLAKFSQNQAEQAFLLATGELVLVEASPVDPLWGIGLREQDARVHHPHQWRGQNLLGFALMAVRTKLCGASAS